MKSNIDEPTKPEPKAEDPASEKADNAEEKDEVKEDVKAEGTSTPTDLSCRRADLSAPQVMLVKTPQLASMAPPPSRTANGSLRVVSPSTRPRS